MNEIIKTMLAKAKIAMKNAHNPYSKFCVGACILADDDNMHIGCNVENVSYRLTTCAEQAAVAAMIAAGAKRIKTIVVVANSDKIVATCGACRQTLAEFSNPDMKVYMFNNKDEMKVMTIAELLPASFSADYLDK
jgi:cytidine deaminase